MDNILIVVVKVDVSDAPGVFFSLDTWNDCLLVTKLTRSAKSADRRHNACKFMRLRSHLIILAVNELH